jgi:hypothetical protein
MFAKNIKNAKTDALIQHSDDVDKILRTTAMPQEILEIIK